MQLAPYVFFAGTCEEALTFYGEVLGGAMTGVNRFTDAPGADSMPPEQRNRIMHATFEAPGVTFMASDGSQAGEAMQRVALSLAMKDPEEGARIFDAFATGGSVTAPYTKQFWGATFGMVVDRFGVSWMINAG